MVLKENQFVNKSIVLSGRGGTDGDHLSLKIKEDKIAVLLFEHGTAKLIKKGGTIEYTARSTVDVKKIKNKKKEILVASKWLTAVNFTGEVIGEENDLFIIDASIFIYMNKQKGIKVGDYVTGGWLSEIRGYLIEK